MQHYCVIGYPVKYSLSPQIHNAGFRALGIDAVFDSAVELAPEKLAVFMSGYREKYAGGNVTIPHKETVMKFLDEIDGEAKAIGAVNTIVNKSGKLIGYNTDSPGAMCALQEGMELQGEKGEWLEGGRVAVLGAGGAARAVVYGVLQAGAEVTIFNRTIEKAKKLSEEFRGTHYASLQDFQPENFEILINTTSCGMYPNHQESPLPMQKTGFFGHLFSKMTGKFVPIVMDIIYFPRETQLIRDAKKSEATTITGDRMFLFQALKAFELWTSLKAPEKTMESALLKALDEREKLLV